VPPGGHVDGPRRARDDSNDPAAYVGEQDPRREDPRHLAQDDAQQGQEVRAVRVPLSLRIFLVSVGFTVATGVLALGLVRQSFQRYYERWERSLATLPPGRFCAGSASESARSLLWRPEREPEVKERDQD